MASSQRDTAAVVDFDVLERLSLGSGRRGGRIVLLVLLWLLDLCLRLCMGRTSPPILGKGNEGQGRTMEGQKNKGGRISPQRSPQGGEELESLNIRYLWLPFFFLLKKYNSANALEAR